MTSSFNSPATPAIPNTSYASKRAEILKTRRYERLYHDAQNSFTPAVWMGKPQDLPKVQRLVEEQARRHSEVQTPYAQAMSEIKSQCIAELLSSRKHSEPQPQQQLPPIRRNSPPALGVYSATPQPLLSPTSTRPEAFRRKPAIMNEWGVVMRHRDSLDELRRLQELEHKKEQQIIYGTELRNQLKEKSETTRSYSQNTLRNDQIMLRDNIQRNRNKDFQERTQLQNMRQLQKERIESQLQEQSRIKKMRREREMREKEELQNMYKLMEKEDQEFQHTRRQQRQQEAFSIRQTLAAQGNFKMQQQLAERQSNRLFSLAESKEMEKQSERRQQFFSKLQSFQLRVDEKEKLFEQYKKASLGELSQRDEKKYMREMEAKLALDAEYSKQLQKMNQQRVYEMQLGLAHQLKTQRAGREKLKAEERVLKQQIDQTVLDTHRSDQVQEDWRKKRKNQYYLDLQKQMEANRVNRMQAGQMSDYERRVNKPHELLQWRGSL